MNPAGLLRSLRVFIEVCKVLSNRKVEPPSIASFEYNHLRCLEKLSISTVVSKVFDRSRGLSAYLSGTYYFLEDRSKSISCMAFDVFSKIDCIFISAIPSCLPSALSNWRGGLLCVPLFSKRELNL